MFLDLPYTKNLQKFYADGGLRGSHGTMASGTINRKKLGIHIGRGGGTGRGLPPVPGAVPVGAIGGIGKGTGFGEGIGGGFGSLPSLPFSSLHFCSDS